jgi:hypothetical protein
MRTVALSLAINLAACVLPAAAVAQVQELPNVPLAPIQAAARWRVVAREHASGCGSLCDRRRRRFSQPVEHAARDARSQLVRARQEIPII